MYNVQLKIVPECINTPTLCYCLTWFPLYTLGECTKYVFSNINVLFLITANHPLLHNVTNRPIVSNDTVRTYEEMIHGTLAML